MTEETRIAKYSTEIPPVEVPPPPLIINGKSALEVDSDYEQAKGPRPRPLNYTESGKTLNPIRRLRLSLHIRNSTTDIIEISLSFSLVTEYWSIVAPPGPGKRHVLPDIFTSSKRPALRG
jgi:hypothetical protein